MVPSNSSRGAGYRCCSAPIAPLFLPIPYCRLNVQCRGAPVLVQQKVNEMLDRLEKLD